MTEAQKKRCSQLAELDMVFNGQEYVGKSEINEDFNVHWTEIICDTDDQWNGKVDKLKTELEKRRS